MEAKVTKGEWKWESDWNPDEVGYPEIEGVVGLYSRSVKQISYSPRGEALVIERTEYCYLDVENQVELETWEDNGDDEEA